MIGALVDARGVAVAIPRDEPLYVEPSNDGPTLVRRIVSPTALATLHYDPSVDRWFASRMAVGPGLGLSIAHRLIDAPVLSNAEPLLLNGRPLALEPVALADGDELARYRFRVVDQRLLSPRRIGTFFAFNPGVTHRWPTWRAVRFGGGPLRTLEPRQRGFNDVDDRAGVPLSAIARVTRAQGATIDPAIAAHFFRGRIIGYAMGDAARIVVTWDGALVPVDEIVRGGTEANARLVALVWSRLTGAEPPFDEERAIRDPRSVMRFLDDHEPVGADVLAGLVRHLFRASWDDERALRDELAVLDEGAMRDLIDAARS